MSNETALKDEIEEEEEEESEDSEESDVEDEEDLTDNVGDPSIEINVEDLIHELESNGLASKLCKEVETRRRLEELMERRRASRDLEDFEDYDV